MRCIKKGEITTKASKDMGRAIAGVAMLEDLIYVVSDKSSVVETFDLETLVFKSSYYLAELANPWDLASCKLNKCLYIMDSSSSVNKSSKYILRVDSDLQALTKWSTIIEEHGNLSVTSDGNVILTLSDWSKLFIYNPDGIRKNVVTLWVDTIHPTHAIKISNDHFLISYGSNKDDIRRICQINENGDLVIASIESMRTSSYLAVDEAGQVFVTDQGNSRVCAFNSDLELMGEVISKKHGLRSPQRICLDRKAQRLVIADNEILEFKRRNGKLLVFNYEYADQNK